MMKGDLAIGEANWLVQYKQQFQYSLGERKTEVDVTPIHKNIGSCQLASAAINRPPKVSRTVRID
jgi:hypothetical protein